MVIERPSPLTPSAQGLLGSRPLPGGRFETGIGEADLTFGPDPRVLDSRRGLGRPWNDRHRP